MSVLEARGISVQLGGRPVLNGVSAAFQPGAITAVVGPNGAGKSTFLSALAGLRGPDVGEITLGSQPLHTLGGRGRARRIAFLPQVVEVAWALDVRTLVSLGLIPFGGGAGDDSRIEDAMETTGVREFAARSVGSLSGGERTRVLLARALVGDPEWLVADEPLAGLDPGHVLEACEILAARTMSAGKGVILTLHDLTVACRVADRVIVLAQGKVIADGAPSEALTPAVLRRAYGVEAQIHAGPGGAVIDIVRMAL